MSLRCKNAIKYGGIKKPRCNNGNPCELCTLKYKFAESLRYITGGYINLTGMDFVDISRLRSRLYELLDKL